MKPKDDPVAYYTTLGLVAGLPWSEARRAAKQIVAERDSLRSRFARALRSMRPQ